MRLIHHLLVLLLSFCPLLAKAQAENIKYIDATTLTVLGQATNVPGHPFSRLNPEQYGIRGSLAFKCLQSTGMCIAFKTDSRIIAAKWKTSNLKVVGTNCGATAQKGLDLYIRDNGRWVFAGVAAPDMKGDCIHHRQTIVSGMNDAEKECLLYLPMFDTIDSLEIGIGKENYVTALQNPFSHRIIFHGSSITHGSAASRSGMNYVSRFERETGLYCINLGFSGQGKLQEFFARSLADIKADAFVFDLFSNPSPDEIRSRFDKFVDIVREAHPDTPLIFVQTIRREKRNFNIEAELLEQAKQDAGRKMTLARRKHDKNVYYIDSKGFLSEDSLSTADGTHPTDKGFSEMLEKLEPELKKILKHYVK